MNLTLQRNGEIALAISPRVPTQHRRKGFKYADESLDFVTQVNSDYPRLEVISRSEKKQAFERGPNTLGSIGSKNHFRQTLKEFRCPISYP